MQSTISRAARFLPRRSPASLRRTVAVPLRSYATDNSEKETKSFKGQLYESTAQRVQRERAEQSRFAGIIEAKRQTGGLPTWVAPFVLLIGILGGYQLSRQSVPATGTRSTLPLSTVEKPKHDITQNNLQAAWTEFRDIVGEDKLSTEDLDIKSHAGSEWSSHPTGPSDFPFCIVRPSSTEEVSKIMKICHKRRIPVTAYSGGTSLEGHYAATQGGVTLDFSEMNNIVELHKEDLDAVVQPAVGWEDLNEELGEHGLFFPPDPGPGAMIGGMVGTGCSGTNAYRYGTMKDWVLGLTVVLADGTIVKTKQRPRKSSAGYDLTRTFIGSEGTLGIVTEATLRLTVKPQSTRVAVCTFKSIQDAANAVFKVVGAGVPIGAVELLDDIQMRCINDAGTTPRKWDETPTLFFKFTGTEASNKENISQVQKLAKAAGSKNFEFARDDQEGSLLWSARKEALWSVMAKRKNETDHVWTTDVAVPISRLPDIIVQTKEDVAKSGLTGAIVGHVGDGNFHTILLYNDKERDIAEDLVHRMVKRAIEMEGTATGEHGVGLIKRDYLDHEIGPNAVDLMRKMKQAFDPLCLLNCDKIVRMLQPKPGEIQEW